MSECMEDWSVPKRVENVFIPIQKKSDMKDCSRYCTITLMPYASKILLKFIQQCMKSTIERELLDVQAGL